MKDFRGIVGLTLLLLMAGCGAISARVERGIENELPDLIGPADVYDVQIEGLRAMTAEARSVSVRGERVQPENAPVLDRLDVTLFGVAYDRENDRLERVDSTFAVAYIQAADLAAYLEGHPNVSEAAVTLHEPDTATVRLSPEVAGFSFTGVPVVLSGRIEVLDGRVAFNVSNLRAAGANLGDSAARRLSEAVNPLVDLTDTRIRLQITDVRVENGEARIEATADPTGTSP